MRPFVEIHEAWVTIQERALDAETLRAQNDQLIAIVLGAGADAEELRQLRALLPLRERLPGRWVPAILIRTGTLGSESTFIVEYDPSVQVLPGAPVVTGAGLLGRIQDAGARGSAVGIDWTHPDFRAGAISADGSAVGMVRVRPGTFREEDRLELQGTDFHITLDPGVEIRTSGGGGVFPRGIPLGTVDVISGSEAGLRRDYGLRAAVSPSGVTHVLIAVAGVGGDGVVSSAWPDDAELERLAAADTTEVGG